MVAKYVIGAMPSIVSVSAQQYEYDHASQTSCSSLNRVSKHPRFPSQTLALL